jgi:hypothetical protein
MLTDTTDPVLAAFVVAYDKAVQTVGECTPDCPRYAARTFSTVYPAEYAASHTDPAYLAIGQTTRLPHLTDHWMGVRWT